MYIIIHYVHCKVFRKYRQTGLLHRLSVPLVRTIDTKHCLTGGLGSSPEQQAGQGPEDLKHQKEEEFKLKSCNLTIIFRTVKQYQVLCRGVTCHLVSVVIVKVAVLVFRMRRALCSCLRDTWSWSRPWRRMQRQ